LEILLVDLKSFVVKHRKIILILASCLVAFALGIGLIFYRCSGRGLKIPSSAQIKAEYRLSEGFLLDRNGAVLQQVRLSFQGRRTEWTPLAEISPALISAVIQAEDQRFYTHHGVDWRGISSAALHGFGSGNWRGASTITMQLLSFLFPETIPRQSHRTIGQKFSQIFIAGRLEKHWTKQEILEAYLNLVSFRGELEGIGSASLGLFGKRPHGLSPGESSILAALIRAPNASSHEVVGRATVLAGKLRWDLSAGELEKKCLEALKPPYRLPQENTLAPHVARILLADSRNQKGLIRIRCTLDGSLQRLTTELLRQHLSELRKRNVQDGAVLIIENAGGEVLAYVGSGGDLSSASHVDGVQALRQAGSSLKPFLYGLAIDKRLLTAASLLEDSPLEISQAGGIYKPENYDHHFRGPVTARMALASSINIPAVRVLQLTGIETFLDKLKAMEFRDLKRPDYYGPSIALGSADVTLWDLTNAYRVLASRGIWTPARLNLEIPPQPNSRMIFSPQAAFIIGDILSDRESRSYTFGLDNPLATSFWTAVKTGTSKDMRDNWCIGYSQRYTVGVWMGNFGGEPMWNVSGVTGAAPLWAKIMSALHQDVRSSSPAPPENLIVQMTEIPNLGIKRQEYFLAQTEMEVVEKRSSPAKARIASPANGETIAWDPDIPADSQKLFFEAQPQSEEFGWELDGQRIGTAKNLFFWTPAAGKHTLKLLSPSGDTVDSVQFTVRGGP
jgi:penicillin-binding protein 1C